MPTREEMIAALTRSKSTPTREEMIAALSGKKQEPKGEPGIVSRLAESTVENLPMIGAGVGGAAGALGGLGVGAVPGAAIGGGIGASAKELINAIRGVYKPVGRQLLDIAKETAMGGTQEFGGQLAGKAITGTGRAVLNKLGPKVGKIVTGVPEQATEAYIKDPELIRTLDPVDVAKKTQQAANDFVTNRLRQTGTELGDALDSTGKKINISNARKYLESHISQLKNQLETGGLKNEPLEQELSNAENVYKKYFTMGETKPGSILTPSGELAQKGGEAIKISDEISARDAVKLMDQLKDISEFTNLNLGVGGKATMAEKTLANNAKRAYGDIAQELDRASDGMIAPIKDEYRNLLNVKASLNKNIGKGEQDLQKAVNFLSNPSGRSKSVFQKTAKELRQMGGPDLNQPAKLVESQKYFAAPEADAISRGGTTSTSRTAGLAGAGGALGYKLGGATGGAVGTYLGAKAASPSALRAGIDILSSTSGRSISPQTLGYSGRSAWSLLSPEEMLKQYLNYGEKQ